MASKNPWWRFWTSKRAQGSSPAAGRAGDRRASKRHRCSAAGTCRPATFGDENQWPACIANVSLGGIGVAAKRRFEPGTLLRVDVNAASEDAPTTLWACVVHVQPQRNGDWLLGCALARQLVESELEALRQVPRKDCTLVHESHQAGV